MCLWNLIWWCEAHNKLRVGKFAFSQVHHFNTCVIEFSKWRE